MAVFGRHKQIVAKRINIFGGAFHIGAATGA
jgi:hypothetical protein